MVLYNINLYKLIRTLFYFTTTTHLLWFWKRVVFRFYFLYQENRASRSKKQSVSDAFIGTRYEISNRGAALASTSFSKVHALSNTSVFFNTHLLNISPTIARNPRIVRFKDQCCLCFPSWWEFWWPSSKSLIIYASTCFYNLWLISRLRAFHRGGMLLRREGILRSCKTRT